MLDIINCDCMDLMREYPDKHFELAIVDPPYGIENKISKGGGSHTKSCVKFHQLYSENHKSWDKAPPPEYFIELKRVTKNQIIWGANYHKQLTPCRGFIIWDKHQAVENFSACEYAYSSFDTPSKIFKLRNYGIFQTDTNVIHPTQKPVALYEWLLTKYAKKGDKILDTHMGSGSIAIACHNLGFDLMACELDKDYYCAAMKRITFHQAQKKLF